jgi:hypothetical protein
VPPSGPAPFPEEKSRHAEGRGQDEGVDAAHGATDSGTGAQDQGSAFIGRGRSSRRRSRGRHHLQYLGVT